MSSQAMWWKNSVLLMLLLAVPLVIASIPRGTQPVASLPSENKSLAAQEAAAEPSPPEHSAAEVSTDSAGTRDGQPVEPVVEPAATPAAESTAESGTPAAEPAAPAAEPAPQAAAVAVVATPSPAADPAPNVSPDDLVSDDGVESWQRDVNERIRKAAMSEVLVSLADGHDTLDSRVTELEAIEKEVEQLRKRLEYLNQLKAKWSGQE